MSIPTPLTAGGLCLVVGLLASPGATADVHPPRAPSAASAPEATCHGEPATIVVTYSYSGIESGTPDRDVVVIKKDANVLEFWAAGGDDVVCLRQGANDDEDAPPTARGGSGDDLLIARAAPYHPHLEGGPGADVLIGSPGFDYLRGGAGPDRIFGYRHYDSLFGEEGDDLLNGGYGDDRGDGGPGRDRCYRVEDRISCSPR